MGFELIGIEFKACLGTGDHCHDDGVGRNSSPTHQHQLDKIDVKSGNQSLEPQGNREEPEENYQTDKSYDDPHNKHCIHFFYILKLYYFTLSTEAFP